MKANGVGRREFLGMAAGVGIAAMTGACRTVNAQGTGADVRRIATFTCDVTPALGTPVYSSFEPLAVIETPLLAKGIVLEDAGQRYVLCAMDWCEICNSTHALFRSKIAEAAGTRPSNVAVQCVHQHTAPMADSDASRIMATSPNPPPFPAASTFEEPASVVAAAVAEVCGRLIPYNQVGTSQAKVERVASNRRVPKGDGTVTFRASSCKDPVLVEAPEGLIDPFLKTVTFARDGAPIARLHYYATHPQSFYGDPRACYDFPGMAREKLQEKEGVFQVYFTGCAGNIAAGKYNDRSPEARQGLLDRLYAAMEASVASVTYEAAGPVRMKAYPLVMTARNDAGFTDEDGRAEMAKTDSAHSVRYTGAMVLAWRARSTTPIEVSALQLGRVQVLHLPGEPAIEYQLFAQETRPGDFVAVAGYGDGAPGYVCLDKFFAEGGYEPTASFTGPGTEAVFRTAIRDILNT